MTAQRVRQFLGFSVVIVVAVVLIAWSGQWAGRREAASQADAVKRSIEVYTLGLRGTASKYNYLPFTASQHQDIIAALEAPTDALMGPSPFARPDCDLAAQPAPDHQVDQCISW